MEVALVVAVAWAVAVAEVPSWLSLWLPSSCFGSESSGDRGNGGTVVFWKWW